MNKHKWIVFFCMIGFLAGTELAEASLFFIPSAVRTAVQNKILPLAIEEEDPDTGFNLITWKVHMPSDGRRVSLTGMPMPNNPPEVQADSDYYREDTYMDAFSVDVQHSVTDIHIPVGSDQLALEVRRTLTQETWGEHGFGPDERPDKPFGRCWLSNLSPSIHWYTDWVGGGYYYVTDHTGQQYTFVTFSTNYEYPFVIATSGEQAIDTMKVKLVKGTDNKFTLTLANGTKLYYSALPDPNINDSIAQAYGGRRVARPAGSSVSIFRYHLFSRLEKVEDRHGSELIYSGGMIPSTITAQPSGLSLSISSSGGRVNSITDPNGNTITYHYDGTVEGIEDVDNGATIRLDDESIDYLYGDEYGWPSGTVLSEVERELGASTKYQYWYLAEEDYRQYSESEGGPYPDGMYVNSSSFSKEDQYHMNIRAITDANSNTYGFRYSTNYDYNFATWSYQNHVHVHMLGLPRLLNNVSVPDGRGAVSLGRNTIGSLSLGSGQYSIQSHRTTTIYDLDGTRWEYAYMQDEDPLRSGEINWMEWRHPSDYSMRCYGPRKLEISNNKGFTETLRFDAIGIIDGQIQGSNADPTVIALGAQEDQWGNQTRYEYGQMTYNPYVSGTRVQPDDVSKPTRRYDAYDNYARYWYNQTEYKSYNPQYEYDEEGKETEYDWLGQLGSDQIGLLEEKRVKSSGGALVQKTSFEYTDTTWPAFMTKKTEHDVGSSDPSFVQRDITYTAHAFGQVETEVIDPSGLAITTTYGYDSNNNPTVVIGPNGHTNWFAYNALNRLVAVTNADMTVRSFGYDLRGNRTSETNENQNVTFWQYDEFNRVTNEVVDLNQNGNIDPADISTKTTYNVMGKVSSVTDPNGTVTTNLYDHLQRLTNSIVDPGGAAYSTSYEYGDNSGSLLFEPYGYQPTKIVDARGYETRITYDELYREVERLEQINLSDYGDLSKYAKTTYEYDDVGNLRYERRWESGTTVQVTETQYDSLNQPSKTKYADNTEVDYDYISTGLLYRQWDELDRLTTTFYDKAQRPWKMELPEVDGSKPTTITQYDASGNATNVINPRTISTAYSYDSRHRRTHEILPSVHDEENNTSGRPVIITYFDDVGNVTGILDARENLTTNFYDAANRLTNSVKPEVALYGGGTTQPYTKTTYDKNGNPRFVEDGNGTVMEMQYDALNRLRKTIDGELNEISYDYDALGNRTWIKDQNGNATVFEYDGLSRNTKIFYADSSEESFGYDWLGNKTSRTDANSTVTEYAYDSRNRLDYVDYLSNSVPYRTRDYAYDKVGNLTNVTESADALATVSYTYDALNRVKKETSSGITHTYGYDKIGNRTDATYGVTGRHIDWDYDALNRIEMITDIQGYSSTINVFGGGNALQTAINGASGGELILVADETYTPVTISKPVTVKSANGAANATIQATSGRCAELSSNARLIGFTLTGGNLIDGKGAGALVGKGCLIADCDIDGNTAGGVNAYGGGLFLQTGATAQNCLIQNNNALNGGGIFCEKGGLIRNCTIEDNEADSMGGGGVFMQDGGWMANSIIDGNIVTNTFARGGGGVLFYNDGGKVNSSTLSSNTSTNTGAAYSHRSTYVDPGKVGEITHSVFWNNTPSGTSNGWTDKGNQTTDPSGVTSAPGADLTVSSYASSGSRTTEYFYDRNSNLRRREFPNGVSEFRNYDALNRLATQTNSSPYMLHSVEYQHDAVGNLREMADTVSGSHTIPQTSTFSWTYDNAYRLESETVTGGTTASTEFDWDAAGNREEVRKYNGAALVSKTVYKTPSSLNQMTGWTSGETNAVYAYDANGCREREFIHTPSGTKTTEYAYDEDNRLTGVMLRDTEQPTVYSFGYDYRTRRISRSDPAETNVFVFSDGLSVQEYSVPQTSSSLTTDNLTTESIRTEGYGGGVGGMVYSVRNGQLEASHSNHRGDVVARTDNRGTLSYFARYYAYGTRFHEIGSTYDRQRANTKDEESAFNGLNEGERWRDLEHGVMFQPDRLGYYDGPNRYVYVQNNPITHYDARGLYAESFVEIGSIGLGIHSLRGNIKEGNTKSAWADAGGIVVDVIALAVPAVPGGVGIGLKAKRAAKMVDAIDTGKDTLKSADKLADGAEAIAKETAKKTTKESTEQVVKETAGETAETVTQAATKQPKGGTYKLKDPETSQVKRTGKSNDLNRRKGEHGRGKDTKDLEFEVDKRTDNPSAQRGREQKIYDQHPEAKADNGGLNKRKPISDKNKNRQKYMDEGDKL